MNIFSIAFFLLFSESSLAEQSFVRGRSSKIGDATHIEFQGRKQWDYELQRIDSKKIELRVPPFDESTEILLQSYQDELIKEINVQKDRAKSYYKVLITLKSEQIESFDYLTDEPSRLVIDLYLPEKDPVSTPVQKVTVPKKQKKEDSFSERRVEGDYRNLKDELGRSPAGEVKVEVSDGSDLDGAEGFPMNGVFDGGDPRFERFRMKDYEIKREAIVASQRNIYIKFPFLKMPISRLQELLEGAAEYSIIPKKNKENKEARFVLYLARKNRSNAFQKSYNYFLSQYPNSKYDEILRNVAGEFYFKKYLENPSGANFKKVEDIYSYLQNKYPGSLLAERNLLLMAYAYFERGDALNTLQYFKKVMALYPETEHWDQAQKAMSEAYLKLNKYDEAEAVLIDLQKNARIAENQIEAEYRLGDVYIAKNDFKKAEKAYLQALEKHPDAGGRYPNAFYNLGEAYFWTPKYKLSLERFVDFLERYPSHPFGAYAMTRIGELLQILGADQSKYMGAFLESSYRYQKAPGSEIAQIRMLSQRMKGMKENELRKVLQDLEVIKENSRLPRIDEFVTLMIAEGYFKRGEFDIAKNTLIEYYQKNPTSTDLEFFRKRIVQNLSEELNQLMVKQEGFSLLEKYQQYSNTWLKGHGRIDLQYILGRAFEQVGVYSESENQFQQIISRLKSMKGTKEEFERRVNEKIPSTDAIRLDLARVYYEQKKFVESQKELSLIEKFGDLQLSQQVEATQIQAQIYKFRREWPLAIKTLTSLIGRIKGEKEAAGLHYDLAEVFAEIGQVDEGLVHADSALQLKPDLWKAIELKGDLLVSKGRTVQAAETYSKLLQAKNNPNGQDQLRFKIGDLLFQSGDSLAAEKIWNQIDQGKQPLLKKMAQEKLKNSQWQDEYKKYINRIPAMQKNQSSPEKENL